MDLLSLEHLIPSLIAGTIGWLLGWFMKPSSKRTGDLTVEGEGALRAEADTLRARVQDLEGRVTTRDQEVSALKTKLASASSAPAAADATAKTSEADDTYALEWQNRYLAARVKYLDSRLAELGEADDGKAETTAKTAAKKKPAPKKKAVARTAASKTKAVAKPKKTAVTKTKATKSKSAATKTAAKAAPAKKAVSKKPAAKKSANKDDAAFERYYTKVKMFDPKASRKVVENIVDYCGISLKSRDSSLVACSDEAELQRVANGFVTKKLGMESGQMDLVKSVCQQMKDQRLKSRVTFYYLAAKKARKLSMFK